MTKTPWIRIKITSTHQLQLKKELITLLLSCLLLLASTTSYSANQTPSKSDQIKAGFLLQFASYVTWKKKDTKEINICIAGTDPFGSFIDEMVSFRPTNRHGQPIKVKHINLDDSMKNCHIIYFKKGEYKKSLSNFYTGIESSLLVSESDDFLENGGVVNLREIKKHIKLEINMQNAIKRNIVISPELLRVAKIIDKETTENTER